jgi:hypothetical protein
LLISADAGTWKGEVCFLNVIWRRAKEAKNFTEYAEEPLLSVFALNKGYGKMVSLGVVE